MSYRCWLVFCITLALTNMLLRSIGPSSKIFGGFQFVQFVLAYVGIASSTQIAPVLPLRKQGNPYRILGSLTWQPGTSAWYWRNFSDTKLASVSRICKAISVMASKISSRASSIGRLPEHELSVLESAGSYPANDHLSMCILYASPSCLISFALAVSSPALTWMCRPSCLTIVHFVTVCFKWSHKDKYLWRNGAILSCYNTEPPIDLQTCAEMNGVLVCCAYFVNCSRRVCDSCESCVYPLNSERQRYSSVISNPVTQPKLLKRYWDSNTVQNWSPATIERFPWTRQSHLGTSPNIWLDLHVTHFKFQEAFRRTRGLSGKLLDERRFHYWYHKN